MCFHFPGGRLFSVGLFLLIALFCGGCASQFETNPARSATEQLLLSSSADRALASVNLDIFAGKTVFLDPTYFDSYDSKYALGEIRDALSRAGALLVSNATNSEIIVEARSGALSIDNDASLVGIPSMNIPIPFSVPIQIPEIAFYKTQIQDSYAKIALLAYANQSRAHIYSSGPLAGTSYSDYHKILFFSWISTDIPEKQTKEKKAEQYKIWSPQYDLENLPTIPPGPGLSPTNTPWPHTRQLRPD
jgi:hypothetical protein